MELEDDFDALDPERLIQCPYNKYHQIRACRFPYHLVKCRKSYPEVAKELATCPFNARHLVPQADLSDHIKKCNDKGFIEQDIVNESSGSQREQMNAVSTWQAPPCDEDWETESLEQSDPPFIWGMTNSGINSATFEKKNCLPSKVRAPGSFPYSASWKGSLLTVRHSQLRAGLNWACLNLHYCGKNDQATSGEFGVRVSLLPEVRSLPGLSDSLPKTTDLLQ